MSEKLVELRIRENIIPTTKTWGLISAILMCIGLLVAGQIIDGIILPVIYYMSILALIILLDGFAEVITLLRVIASRGIPLGIGNPISEAGISSTPAKPSIPPVQAMAKSSSSAKEGYEDCPFCKRSVPITVVKCPYCEKRIRAI